MGKKIYLSGKISGDPDFKEKFAQKAKELTEQGHLVFNPALHPDMFTWEQFMELDLKALANCDSIYLLDDWKESRGAKIEYDEALRLGKEVLFEEKREIDNSIKAEIQEYKSYKFRVTLEDGSQTPWQYSDHNPSKNDLGDVPIARQFEKVNPLNGKKELFPREFVWAECEYSCDIDYQEDAMKNGYTENGSFRHSYAGLQKVPEHGCYRYRTNPDPNTEEWIITGKIKVNRILSGKEVDDICRKAGKEPQKREKTFEELESLLIKSLSREVYDYTPFKNKEEADLFKVKREKEMVKRIEHELDKNKLFHDKGFLSFMNHKYENIQSMACHYSNIVKDNLVRARELER